MVAFVWKTEKSDYLCARIINSEENMKTNIQSLLHLAVLACAVWLLFACSAESMSVHDVEGEYNGTVDAVVSGVSLGTIGTAHTVVNSPDNLKLRIAFEGLTVAAHELGSFVVDCGVRYDERNGRFNLYGDPQVEFENYGKVPATVSGEANGGMIGLLLDVSAPLNMKLEYTGFKKK